MAVNEDMRQDANCSGFIGWMEDMVQVTQTRVGWPIGAFPYTWYITIYGIIINGLPHIRSNGSPQLLPHATATSMEKHLHIGNGLQPDVTTHKTQA